MFFRSQHQRILLNRHRVFDTHCHIGIRNSFLKSDADLLPIYERSVSQGNVQGMTIVGIDLETSRQCQNIVSRLNNNHSQNNNECKLGYSVGLHPHWADRYREEFPEMKKMILDATTNKSKTTSIAQQQEQEQEQKVESSPRLVAIGETGLDYFKSRSPIEDQKESLKLHLRLAAETNLPVIIHCRNADRRDRGAHEDLFDIIENEIDNKNNVNHENTNKSTIGGVIHCFSDDVRSIDRVMKLNRMNQSHTNPSGKWFVSFCCTLAYPRSHNLREACEKCDLRYVVVETDSPYLPPFDRRGTKNEPMHVNYALDAVVDCKMHNSNEYRGMSREEVRKEIGEQLWKNSLELFRY